MQRWQRLSSAPVPEGDDALELWQRGAEYSIRLRRGGELMNSRASGSERELARVGLAHLAGARDVRVLIGGLGMGYTLAAALQVLGPEAEVHVAELSAAVVDWNRSVLGALAGHPLQDPRARIAVIDVATPLRDAASWDAVLLDVDNGPEGLTRPGNDALYSAAGLLRARQALRPGGALAIWSAHPSPSFLRRLEAAGFAVREHLARARGAAGGARHRLWIGRAAAAGHSTRPSRSH